MLYVHPPTNTLSYYHNILMLFQDQPVREEHFETDFRYAPFAPYRIFLSTEFEVVLKWQSSLM